MVDDDDDVLNERGYDDEDEREPRSPGSKKDPAADDERRQDTDEDRRSETDEDDEETAEARASRRQQERQKQRDRQKQARERDRRKLEEQGRRIDELQALLGNVAQRLTGQDAANFEGAVASAKARVENARAKLRQATESGEPNAIVEATDALYDARRESERLEGMSQQRREAPERRRQDEGRQSAPDAVIKSHYDDFVSRHDWFNPNGRDEDSAEARRIDQQLAASGSDPRTPEHWRRLEREIKKSMPHLFEEDEAPRRSRPPVGGGGRDAGRRGANEGFVLSRERKEAMIESGIWDDPARRAKMIESYKAYDRQNSAR